MSFDKKIDWFAAYQRRVFREKYIDELTELDLFEFKEVENDDLNRMSINHVVEDITFTDYIVKLTHTDNTWLK